MNASEIPTNKERISSGYMIVFFLILSSTNFLMFISTDHLPGIDFGDTHVTYLDFILMGLGLFCMLSYIKSKKNILLKSIFLLLIFIFAEFIIQLISGRGIYFGGNILKAFLVYMFYFIAIYFIRTPQDVVKLVKLLTIMVVVSAIMHAIEFILDERIYFKALYTPNRTGLVDNFSSTWQIPVGNEPNQFTAYIWNRATIWVYFIFVISSISLLNGIGKTRNTFLIIIAISVFLMAMIRSWMITASFSVLMVSILSGKYKIVLKNIARIVIAFFVLSFILSFFNVIDIQFLKYMFTSRIDSIISSLYGYNTTDANFMIRQVKWGAQYTHFMDSSIFGYGMTFEFSQYFDPDTGIINTLLFGGIIGTSIILFIIFRFIYSAFLLYKNINDKYWKSLIGGFMLIIVGLLPMYFFNIDFFTSILFGGQNIWLPVTCFALIYKTAEFKELGVIT